MSTTTHAPAPSRLPDPRPDGSATRPGLPHLLTGAVVVAVLVLGWSRRWTADDAFINFRVVANLLAGNGPVFNAGERIEVATSPLWLFLLTAAEAVVPGTAVAWASVVLGLLLTATGVGAATAAGYRLVGRGSVGVPFGMAVFAALPVAWDFTTSGLETGLSFGWLGVSFWGLVRSSQDGGRPVWLLVLLGLGPLVRPDLALVSGVLLLWLVLRGRGRWWQRVGALALAGVLPVAWQLFRMGYYGLLVPNTAVAKESGRALWGRGLTYLLDLLGPHLLWIPLLTAVLLAIATRPTTATGPRMAAATGPRKATAEGPRKAAAEGPRMAGWWRVPERSLVGAVVVAGVLHAVYVVRVGGDFMHGRLLLPSLFLLLCAVAVVPVTRRTTALLVVTALWVLASVTVLRDHTGRESDWIADERAHYAAQARNGHPVTLADHGQAGVLAYSDQVVALAGQDVIAVQVPPPITPQTRLPVLAASSGGVVFSVGNAGFYSVAPGLDVRVVDVYGLTDPVASHLVAPAPRRPGHEKRFPRAWLLARYGAPELAVRTGADLPPPQEVAAGRAALACGPVAELIEATNAPLTWDRFWENLVGAPERTSLRIPTDPVDAEAAFC